MYPYSNLPAQNPLAGFNLYDPAIRNWVMQNAPQYAGMLPQQVSQPQYVSQQQFVQPQAPAAQDFGLTIAEQQFLYQNANLIPYFYQTPDGKALNRMLVEGIQKMLGVSNGANTTAATEPGTTAGR